MQRFLIAIVVLTGFTFASCGADRAVDAVARNEPAEMPEPTTTEPPAYDPVASEPPPVEVTRGNTSLTLDPWAYCWTPAQGDIGICADGEPPAVLQTLAGTGSITVSFPADFNFFARLYDANDQGELGVLSAVATDGGWRIDPDTDGPAILELFGNGPEGDVIVSFVIE